MTQENILLARQPIFDTQLNIYAYELLFRADQQDQDFNEIGADTATSMVIFNAFSEVGIHNVVGEHRAFVNFTRNLILDPPPFTSGEIVIEVLEDVQPELDILESLRQFKKQGYTIALDDFKYHESLQPLVDLADIIKIDVLELTRDELIAHAAMLQNEHTKLLAEKVESQEMYNFCKELGFSYFQGYFLSRPKAVKGRKIPADKLVVMKLLSDLQNPEINPQQLNDTISKDAALSFKLLRMVNSAAYRRPNKIESLYRAILLIGLKDIKHWASLLALTNLEDKPHALAELTMTRAKMCELIGTHINSERSDLFYTVGMLSMLDAYFDMPLRSLLASMSFTDEINNALLDYQGELGFVLKTAITYANGEWGKIDWEGLSNHRLSIADIKEAYLESLQWYEERGEAMLSESLRQR